MSKLVTLDGIALVLFILAFIWRFYAKKGHKNEFITTHEQQMNNLRNMMYVEMVCWIIALVDLTFPIVYLPSERSGVLGQIEASLLHFFAMALLLRYILFLKNDRRPWNAKIDDYSFFTLFILLLSIKTLCFPQYAGLSILKILIIIGIIHLIKDGLKKIARFFWF